MRTLILLLALSAPAFAQHNHAQGHSDYLGWSSRKTPNCCNNQDCGALTNEDYRQTNAGIEVKIGIDWCPVKPEHFLIRGKSPDWNTPHACVNKSFSWHGKLCDRLLCFTGVGGI